MVKLEVGSFSSFLKEFAPPKAVVLGQSVLFIIGILLSSWTKLPINISWPNLLELSIAILFGLLCGVIPPLLSMKSNFLRQILRWIFSANLREYGKAWTFYILPFIVAVGEETFFRSFLLPKFGLILSTFLFAIYHIRANTKSVFIILGAFVLGLPLGISYIITDNLAIPIILHFSILFFMGYSFYLLNQRKI